MKKPGRHAMTAVNRLGLSTKAAGAILRDQIRRLRRNPTNIDHADYQAKVRGLSDSALRYAMRDAAAAIKAHPTGHKAGYYQDEIHYCADELARRKRGGSRANPRRKGRRIRVDEAASRLAWWRHHHNPPVRLRFPLNKELPGWDDALAAHNLQLEALDYLSQGTKRGREAAAAAARAAARHASAARRQGYPVDNNPSSRDLSKVIAALNNPRRRRSRK